MQLSSSKTNTNSSHLGLIMSSIGIGLLVLLDVSMATWSPHLHPQHHRQPLSSWQEEQQQQQQQASGGDSWRGGSTALHSPSSSSSSSAESELQPYDYNNDDMQQQQELQTSSSPPTTTTQQQEEPFQPPKVHLKHVSMALRLTSEWNRRLSEGINKMKHWGLGRRLQLQQQQQQQQQQQLEYHPSENGEEYNPYGDVPVNVHPSRAWQPPIPASKDNSANDQEEELTVFHAKAPYPQTETLQVSAAAAATTTTTTTVKYRGVSHWGPDLHEMLEELVEQLGVTDDGVEIPLAMIYLDRACSVETIRSNNVAACPFCAPRTVHRLCLAALWMAMEAVHGNAGAQRMKEALFQENSDASTSATLDIPEDELQQMIGWMKAALGDFGLMVTVDQMKSWSLSWESIFSTASAARLQQRPQPQQFLEASEHD